MDEHLFESMEYMADRILLYKQLCSVVSILLMAKNLRVLTSKFPSFGVLFETIDAAKGDLLYFTIISGVMVVSFTMIFYCLFGANEDEYSTVRSAMMAVLKMVFGEDMFP